MAKETYFLTFGSNSALAKRFVAVRAETEEEAREVAQRTFGQSWSMIYDVALFAGQQKKHGIKLLCAFVLTGRGRWEALTYDELMTDELMQWHDWIVTL